MGKRFRLLVPIFSLGVVKAEHKGRVEHKSLKGSFKLGEGPDTRRTSDAL